MAAADHDLPWQAAFDEVMSYIHESPLTMTIPLFVLAIGAVFSGFIFYDLFVGHHWQDFWGNSIMILPENTEWPRRICAQDHQVYAADCRYAGVAMAYLAYMIFPSLPGLLTTLFKPIHQLFFNKWFFDELYDAVFVRPAVRTASALVAGRYRND